MINIRCGSMVRVNSNEGAPSLTPVTKSVRKVSLWTFVVSQYRRLKASKGLASAGLMFFTLTISVKSHHKKTVRIRSGWKRRGKFCYQDYKWERTETVTVLKTKKRIRRP